MCLSLKFTLLLFSFFESGRLRDLDKCHAYILGRNHAVDSFPSGTTHRLKSAVAISFFSLSLDLAFEGVSTYCALLPYVDKCRKTSQSQDVPCKEDEFVTRIDLMGSHKLKSFS